MRLGSVLAVAMLGPLSWTLPAAAVECGAPSRPCQVALGNYHAVAPPLRPGEQPRGIVVHFHGAGASGAAVIRDLVALTDAVTSRGYILVAPNGLIPPGRTGGSWSFGVRPPLRDELAFTRQVLDDAVARFHGDRSHVLLTGFSIGGSLVWYLACATPSEFAAYAPLAGGFWRPHPSDCAGPVKLLHTHGWRDQTVPLEGSPLRSGLSQGDIFEGLQLWRQKNGCGGLRPDKFQTTGYFWRRTWTSCAPGTALELAMFPGEHEIPMPWAPMILDWFEKVVPAASD